MKFKSTSFFLIAFLLINIILVSGSINVNAATIPLTAGVYQETNSNIKFSGSWIVHNDSRHIGSSAKYSTTPGNYIEFSFTGTGFKWITPVNPNRGIAKITIDGVTSNVNNYSSTSLYQKVIYQKTNLALGTHTVKIEVTPNKSTASNNVAIAFDAVEILNTPVSSAIPLTAGKHQETNSNIKFLGNWIVHNDTRHSSSSAKYSTTPGNSIQFSFKGTGFKWITPVNANRGIAKITIDGVSSSVNNYSSTSLYQKVIYQKTDLALGTHTVKIEVTPNKSAASNNVAIAFDAVEILNTPVVVVTPSNALTAGLHQETSSNIKLVGNWIDHNDARHSGSSAIYSTTPGNSIQFSFTGIGFKWITPINACRGIAKVTVDGVVYNVNNYSSTTQYQNVIYQKTGLTYGTHTVKIEVTPNKVAASINVAIAFDAVEILNTPVEVPLSVISIE